MKIYYVWNVDNDDLFSFWFDTIFLPTKKKTNNCNFYETENQNEEKQTMKYFRWKIEIKTNEMNELHF